MRWVQAISREGQTKRFATTWPVEEILARLEPSETVRRILTSVEVKIQSELLGDQERQAEMPCPSPRNIGGSNKTVGPYPLWAQEA